MNERTTKKRNRNLKETKTEMLFVHKVTTQAAVLCVDARKLA